MRWTIQCLVHDLICFASEHEDLDRETCFFHWLKQQLIALYDIVAE